MTKVFIPLALLGLGGRSNIFPICDNKDKSGIPHPEHFPGTTVEEPAPIAAGQEAFEQVGCRLGI